MKTIWKYVITVRKSSDLSMKMDKTRFQTFSTFCFFLVPSFAIIKTSKLGLHTDPVSMPPRNNTREFESWSLPWNRKIQRAVDNPKTDHLKLEVFPWKQPKQKKNYGQFQSYLINPKLWRHIFVDVRIEFDSPFPMKHSPLVLQCSESRYVFSRNHRFGMRKKTKHSATLCLWPCNSPTPGLNCAGAGRLWSSSDVQSFKTQIYLPTHNELHRKNVTKNDKNFKQNQKKPSNNVTPLLNHLERMEIHWTHLDVNSGSSVATCKQSFVEKHCVSVSMRFSMDLCGSNHSSFWSDINAEVRLDMCPHACWHLQV